MKKKKKDCFLMILLAIDEETLESDSLSVSFLIVNLRNYFEMLIFQLNKQTIELIIYAVKCLK